nr:hypothetical protein [Tanacetum cinerariifolium]
MMLDSIDNGPLFYLTVEENRQTRPKKYSELTKAQQLQDVCDVQEANIILYGLPPDVYALVNHQEAAKDIWDRVKLLKNGTELSYQEHKCRLYNLFDKFSYVQVNPQQQSVSPQPFISPPVTLQSQAEFPQLDFGLVVLIFQQGDDPIECINKEMAFLSAMASRFSPSNNQLRTSFNPRHQATIYDGRVTIQQVQGRQTHSFAGTRNQRIATTSRGNYTVGQAKIVKCYNCLRKGIWRNSALRQRGHETIPHNMAFQAKDLDAYDSNYDDISSAKVVLMANLSSCDPDVLSEVPYFDSYPNDMINQDVQEMSYSEQTHINDYPDNEINSDSNIIPYSQYLQKSQDAGIQDTNCFKPNDLLVLSLVEQMTDHVANLDKENQTNKMVNKSLTAALERSPFLNKDLM